MRDKLIEALAYGWRYAENMYLDYDDSTMKEYLKGIQDECNLTKKEVRSLEEWVDSMGV